MTKLADKDSSSTIPPAEEGVRGQNTRAVTEEGCMREDEGRIREIEEYMRDNEIEEDTSGLGEANFLNGLKTDVHSDQLLPILSKGNEGAVEGAVDELITQEKADSNLAEIGGKQRRRKMDICGKMEFWYMSSWYVLGGNGCELLSLIVDIGKLSM